MTETAVSSDKIVAYLATHYRLHRGSEAFTLRIGVPSGNLRQLYDQTGENCGLFITAFNPFGQMQTDDANEAAHTQLGVHLRALATNVIEGVGEDPTGEWRPEMSYFALGIELEKARDLGDIFQQNAVVWVGADTVPRLLLLR